jgi:excisionase family DNA binding protein
MEVRGLIDDLIGTTEAAEILGVTPGRVRTLVKENRFPGHRMVLGRLMIPRAEVLAWKAQARRVGRPKREERGNLGGCVMAAC